MLNYTYFQMESSKINQYSSRFASNKFIKGILQTKPLSFSDLSSRRLKRVRFLMANIRCGNGNATGCLQLICLHFGIKRGQVAFAS